MLNGVTIIECTSESLVGYVKEENQRRQAEITPDEKLVLDTEHLTSTLNNQYLLMTHGEVVGFAVTPKYMHCSLMRLYVTPNKRRLGIGRHVLDYLQILNLGCLTTNTEGIAFYKAAGFTSTVGFSPHMVIFKRESVK